MANTHPDLAKEYLGDATKIIAGTHKRLDWECIFCSNKWRATGNDRANGGNGCPACSKWGYDPSKIGYVYVLQYSDGRNDWLKCGITNLPKKRLNSLKASANRLNIEISELEIYRFDDGAIPRNCESELLAKKEIRYDSGYNVDGKNEFFKYESLQTILDFIEKW